MVEQHYRWDFVGLSTDVKPTPQTSEKVVDGSTFYCADNSKLYVYCEDNWYERKPLGGGGGGTTDFEDLDNRPKYNGQLMTGETDIPAVVTYTAGSNITITNGEISATDTTYTAGTNVSISDQNVISATDTTYSNFTGTDGTAAGAAGLVPAPATTDAGKFLKADGTWDTAGGGSSYTAGDGINITNNVISATNTGKAKILTTADYNWPTTGTKTSVALWLLEPGIYCGPEDGTYVNVRPVAATSEGMGNGYANMAVVLKTVNNATQQGEVMFLSAGNGASYLYYGIQSDGNFDGYKNLATRVVDNLTSTSTTNALSANQGKTLKALVDGISQSGSGAPTTSTVGTVGQLYQDTTNGKLYICTAIVPGTDPDPDTYTWTEVGAGGSGPTVVQTTGTSTTDVMSQDASTKMVYAASDRTKINIGDDTNRYINTNGILIGSVTNQPVSNYSIKIGYGGGNVNDNYSVAVGHASKTSGQNAIALGHNAQAQFAKSVAIGANSKTTMAGQFDISSGDIVDGGYNSTNYRLLTGLYDGQSAHDAATKGQLDGIVLTNAGAPTTSTVGTVGQLLEDTTNGKLYICTDTTGGTYTWTEVGAGGSGPTVVQTTGTSTTNVMSQNATTSMVFADPSTKKKICIGAGATNGVEHGISIGSDSSVNYSGCIALGAYSGAYGTFTQRGMMHIGSSQTDYGYNSSNYRLLTGLYDGQSNHDAATVAQGNKLMSTAPATTDAGVLGQLWTDTTGMHTYQLTAIDTTDPDNPSYTWTQRW